MKKLISVIVAVTMLLAVFSGCSAKGEDSGKLKIVTTIFPEYDWLKNITDGVEDVNVSVLVDNGTDVHSYQPTTDDIVTIATCDVFIYVGGESDQWVEDALKQATNQDMLVINLLDELGNAAKEEEVVEGMQAERGDDGDETEYDEHIWLSLKNASILTQRISQYLCQKHPDNKDSYEKNTEEYVAKLKKLDAEYASVCDAAKQKTLLFADRFPFRYLADDYGLTYYAAFAGCSSESEASFETVSFLADKLKELNLSCVMTLENADNRLAQTIISTSGLQNVKILALNSMQSVAVKDDENSADYLEMMEENLTVLKTALG